MAELSPPKPTIVLIHGLWMTPLSWEYWIARWRSKGFEVFAPGWPGIDERTPAEVRANPVPLTDKSITDIVNRYDAFIRSLPKPPLIIGHGVGGLFVQILLSRSLGCAGVAIAPIQPARVFSLPFSTFRATPPFLANALDYSDMVNITADQFHYCFGNHLNREESNALHHRYTVPSLAHILWPGALGRLNQGGPATVEFIRATRVPLLLISGTNDHVAAQPIVEKEFAAYDRMGPGVVELKIFESRTHGIINQRGWEEVADYALGWVRKELSAGRRWFAPCERIH